MSENFFEDLMAIGRRAGFNAATVIADAAKRIGSGQFNSSSWVKAATQLYDIGFLSFMEIAESAGNTQLEQESTVTEVLQVAAAESERQLALASPLLRLGSVEDIVPDECVTFDPSVLPAGAGEFCIVVTPNPCPSGLYTGRVSVGNLVIPLNILL